MSARDRRPGARWWETERRGLLSSKDRYPSTWFDVIPEQLRVGGRQLCEMFERAIDIAVTRHDFDLVQMSCLHCGARSARVPWAVMPEYWRRDCPVCGSWLWRLGSE